ncbi:hypothetical protein N7462_004737 [Penicillium macrosclerotiorum]|uniref:uncharacterized protein n=1 Tax=Penicillium macrosclerotiorum TaxID=303699 RepID=UPI0025473623|nr:uncharacterized protein N7462_004737 [Penicillium macrosclerotiorum]KAJ5690345.1 hypothetical protein N7462_004737 [Penicillium macrosclerotiorum]
MDAQPLTAPMSISSLSCSSADSFREPTLHPSHDRSAPSPISDSQVRRSWSLKRLLGRGSRRYRVLEREPNRLRKRVSG